MKLKTDCILVVTDADKKVVCATDNLFLARDIFNSIGEKISFHSPLSGISWRNYIHSSFRQDKSCHPQLEMDIKYWNDHGELKV